MSTDSRSFEFGDLSFWHDDGPRIVSPSFSIALFTDQDLTEIPDQLLQVVDTYLERCGRDRMKFFTDEKMHRARAVNRRTFGLLEKWVRNTGKGRRNMIHMVMQDGENYLSTADYGINVLGFEPGMTGYGKYSNLVRMIFPPDYGLENEAELYEYAIQLCEAFPVTSGLAGFNLERSEYYVAQADPIAWRLSMEHPVFDIARDTQDCRGVGRDGIKGVGWLTIVGAAHMEALGGVEIVDKIVENVGSVQTVDNRASVIRLGNAPALGLNSSSLSPYRKLFHVLEPLIVPTQMRLGSFSLPGDDYVEKKREWVARLGD